MAAQLITVSTFFNRIGQPNEQPTDRKFCSAMMLWQWRQDWRDAEKAGDFSRMDQLDREYELCFAL